jgi:hypothetical protein
MHIIYFWSLPLSYIYIYIGLEFELRALLYHLSHTSNSFCSGCFGDGGLSNDLPWLTSNTILLISASQVARIPGVSLSDQYWVNLYFLVCLFTCIHESRFCIWEKTCPVCPSESGLFYLTWSSLTNWMGLCSSKTSFTKNSRWAGFDLRVIICQTLF